MKTQNPQRIRQYLMFLAGLFYMGLGIGLVTKSNLGTSPISSVPYVLSMTLPISMGTLISRVGKRHMIKNKLEKSA